VSAPSWKTTRGGSTSPPGEVEITGAIGEKAEDRGNEVGVGVGIIVEGTEGVAVKSKFSKPARVGETGGAVVLGTVNLALEIPVPLKISPKISKSFPLDELAGGGGLDAVGEPKISKSKMLPPEEAGAVSLAGVVSILGAFFHRFCFFLHFFPQLRKSSFLIFHPLDFVHKKLTLFIKVIRRE